MLNSWNFGYNFTATNGVTPTINTINQGMDKLGENSAEEAAKVQKSFFEMETAAKAAAHGVAAINLMKEMKHDFADFEAGMAEASTLLIGASVDMKAYEDSLISMSLKYGELPAEMTKSLYTAISSGFVSASDSTALLDQSMKLAVGGVTTAAEAMDGLTTILHSWGMTAADVGRVSDTLFVGMRAGKTTIGELSREIGQVAAFAYQAGVSLEEVTASAAALTLGGRTTSEAMNGLRSIMTEVMRQEPGVMKTVEELEKKSGIDLKFSMSGLREKGLGKFLQDINTAVRLAGSETGIARLFGRVQGMSAVMSLTGAQAEKFTEIMDQMNSKTGSTEDAVGKMMATSRMETKRYEASVKVMRIEIGRALQPVLSVIRKVKQAFVDMFTSIARRAPWLIQLVAGLALVGATIAIVIAKIIALKATFGVLLLFGKAVVGGLVSAFAALAPVILPIAAAVAGVVAVLYILKRAYEENWGGFTEWVDNATQSVYYLFSALKQLALTGEISGPTAEFLVMNETVYSLVQGVWYLATAFKWLIGGMLVGFSAVGDILEPIKGQFEAIGQMFSRIGRIFEDTFGELGLLEDNVIGPMKVLGAIGWATGYAIAWMLRAIAAMLGVIISGLSAIVAVFVAKFNMIVEIVKGFIRIFTGDFKGGIAQILTAFVQFGAAILSIVWSVIDSVVFGFLSMFGVTRAEWEAFLTDFGAFFQAIGRGILFVLNGIYEGWKFIFTQMGNFFYWVIGGISSVWGSFVDFFRMVWENTIGRLIENLGFLGTAFEVIGGFLKAIWEPIFKWFESKLGWIKDAVDGLKDIAGDIGDFVSDVGSAIADVGSQMKSGIVNAAGNIFGSGKVQRLEAFAPGGLGASPWGAPAVPVVGSAVPGGAVTPSGATVGAQAKGGGAGGRAPIVQVVAPPGKAVINVDGRVLAEAVMTHTDAKKEEQMKPVIPVWTGFGGA